MVKVDVIDWNKKVVGSVDLKSEIFDVESKKSILHDVVKWQLASRRRGTHKTKSKGEVRGGGKKPFKQKGTGSARQGSSRSPLMPGGGTAFGPKPRDYSYTLPKKIKQEGLRQALTYLRKEGKLFVMSDFKSETGKTKEMAAKFKGLGLPKVVLIGGKLDDSFNRATRNLSKIRYYGTEGLNVYDLLKYDAAVLSKDAIAGIEARCGLGS
jgi:large subunit ribosomal protein L4